MKAKKKRAIIILSLLLVVLIIIGCGVFSFLTGKDEVTNTITAGNVSIELYERDYPGNDTSETENLISNTSIKKNPSIKNTGTMSAYVFLRVHVPVENITEVSFDGTKGDKKAQEIFYLKTKDMSQTDLTNGFNSDWIELENEENNSPYTSGTARTYIFGYKKSLDVNEETSTLFDKVQLKNIIENEILSGSTLNVDVEALAIQTDYLGEDFPKDNLSSEQLTKIYQMLNH